MLRGMDWWTFGGADASIASTWFGLHHARLKVVVLQRTLVSSFGCFVFEFWMLRFRVLDALFSSFGCSVFEFWVLRFRVLGTIALSIVSVPIAQRSNIHVLPSFSFILFSGIRSFRSRGRSFQVRSFHKVVSSFHIYYICFLNIACGAGVFWVGETMFVFVLL